MSERHPEPDLEYMKQVLLEMLAIPSPTGFTDTIVRYVAERLDELGIPYELTRRGTIRATLKGRQSSPDRAVSAHLDTIGASVRQLQDNGRLGLSPVGCWSSRFAEGSRVSVFTDTGVYRGSVLPLMASGHAFNTAIDRCRSAGNTSNCAWTPTAPPAPTVKRWGSTWAISSPSTPCPSSPKAATSAPATSMTRPVWPPCWLQHSRPWWKSGRQPLIDCHPLFTITEETGSGAAAALPWDVSEFVGIDIAPVAPGQASSEHAVSVAMQDSSGPYDYHLSRHLLKLAEKSASCRYAGMCSATTSAMPHSAVTAGHDIRTALVAFGCDATHGYERTHIDSLAPSAVCWQATCSARGVRQRFESDQCVARTLQPSTGARRADGERHASAAGGQSGGNKT